MKSLNRFKTRILLITLIGTLFLLPLFLKVQLTMTQETYPEIKSFSNDTLLSIDDNIYPHHVEVSMAISDNGIIFVGWKNSETHNGGGVRVSMVKSFDGGETWTSPYNMPMFEGRSTGQSDPWLYWYNGTIYYAYLEYENDVDGLTQITVAKSDDDGEIWTLVNATNATYFADKETFVVGENNTIYVAYDDVDTSLSGNATVRVSRSLDGGYNYQDNSSLGEDADFVGPYITLNQTGDIFIAWSWLPETGGNLYFTKSQNGGQSFDQPQLINQDGNFCMFEVVGGYPSKATLPVIEFDQNNRLYIIWADKFDQQGDTWDIYLRYSDNFGRTWSDRIRVNPSLTGNQWNPDVTIDESGRLHIVYYSEQGGRYRPYYRTLNFTGTYRNEVVFSEEIPITQSFSSNYFSRPGEYFTIQLDNNNIPHIAWSDARNNEMDIYYSHGLTYIPSQFPLELIIIITIIGIIGFISIVIVLYMKYKHDINRVSKKKLEKKIENYKKTFKYICSNCHEFTSTLRGYCEKCGAKDTLKRASRDEFKNYLPDLI